MIVLMATATHPHYTINFLKSIAPDISPAVKEKIVSELISSISMDSVGGGAFTDSTKVMDEIDLLICPQGGRNISEGRQNDFGDDIKLAMDC